MAGKGFFVDTSKCTACRGCQVSCKQWNRLPATKTKQRGTHQNPADLSAVTWRLVHFEEYEGAHDKPVWYFFSEACRHCLEPPCKSVADNYRKGAIVVDKATGAVIFTPNTRAVAKQFKEIYEACPYRIPRLDAKTKVMAKCTMCLDRVKAGQLPACAKACPTGSITFGDLDKITAAAKARLAVVKKAFPKAQVLSLGDVRVLFLVTDKPERYAKYAAG